MTPNDFSMLHDNDITKSVHALTAEASKLKLEIFKAIVMGKDIDKTVPQFFLAYVNDFLRSWSEYADDLSSKMKGCKAKDGVQSIPYEFIKDYVFAKYDYASMLQFTDGLVKGVNEKQFKVDDVEDFRDHTLDKAFKNRASTTAGLVDEVIRTGNGPAFTQTTKADAALFDSVKEQHIFDRRDRAELYKSIEKTVEFMAFDINKKRYFITKDIKLLVSLVNNVVEYITYSLTAYATRIYIISSYAYPFIHMNSADNAYAAESTEFIDKPATGLEITVMKDASEMVCRDIRSIDDFAEIFENFLKMIGATGLFNDVNHRYYHISTKDLETNAFCSRLMSNALHEFLRSSEFIDVVYDGAPDQLAKLKSTFNGFIYNANHGIQGVTSPKQEILHVIRGTIPEAETVKGYQDIASDLYKCSMSMLYTIKNAFNNIMNWKEREQREPRFNSNTLSTAVEITRMLGELYRDLSTAVLQKCRDIEMKINDLRGNDLNRVSADVSIKIPGGEKPDTSVNDNMMTAVPDTTRMPTELIDLYALPAFESMQMYDEYVKSLPEMQGDAYYEAVNLNQLVNDIMSLLKGIMNRWNQFFNDKNFQRAVKWVKDHQNDLNNMTFAGPMEVLPYKKDTAIAHIDKLINALQNGFTAETVKSEDNLNKFIDSLYDGGNPKLLACFDSKKTDAKNANILYQNWILFGLDPSLDASLKVQPKTLADSSAIAEELKIWLDNVANADGTHKGLVAKSKEVDTAFNAFKTKIVGINNDNKNSGSSSSNNDAAPSMTGGNDQQASSSTVAPGSTNQTQNTDNSDMANQALLKVKTAIDQLWVSLYNAVTKSIKDQYKYIQEAYSKGRK